MVEETLQAVNGLQFLALFIASATLYWYATHDKRNNMESKTIEYTRELFADVLENQLDYWQLGETVCGAEDPAVITVSAEFSEKHPEFKGYTVVRVIDRYVSPWKSDTLLEFSNREITSDEYQAADEYLGD